VQNFSALLLNLDRDTARREHMEKQLELACISFSRQSGVLGDAVPDALLPYFYDPFGRPKTTMKRGEIGCYASHLLALQRIASGELGEAVLVMEDDLDLDQGLADIIAEARHKAPSGWDILRLSSPSRRAFVPLAKVGSNHLLVRYSKIPNSAGAYLVTPKGAQKFLERGIRGLTFDDDLRRPWFHDMETFGVLPPPVKAGVLTSTIDAVEAGRFDKGMSSRMERFLRGDHFFALKRIAYNARNLGVLNWIKCCGINVVDMAARRVFRRSIVQVSAKIKAF